MPEGKKHSGETAGKEFAIGVLLKESRRPHRPLSFLGDNPNPTHDTPDMEVLLIHMGDEESVLAQQTGRLRQEVPSVVRHWQTTLTGEGKITSVFLGDEPVEILDGNEGHTQLEGEELLQITRAEAEEQALHALQFLRQLPVAGG